MSADILHNDFCYNNLTENPDKFGEPVYINTNPPVPKPEPVIRKDVDIFGKIGLSVICIYLFYKYILKED